MPGAHRRSKEAKQLKTAGLITIAVASLLMMMWAVFPSAVAFAGSGTEQDPFGPGDKVSFCHYDGSDNGGGGSGKYNAPDASVTATGPAGHTDHAFDVIPSYWFQQNQNADPEFFAGVNWPTLSDLPSSPVDFTPLIGSSASAFIAGGCGEPTTTSTSAPPCPSGTTTVTHTTMTTVTQTSTVTETSGAQSLLGATQGGGDGEGGDRALQEGECLTTTTETQTTTTGTTTTTTVPFCPEGSQTTTITQTAPTTTTTVTVGDVPNQQPAECTSTETTTTTPTETTTVTTTAEECPSGTTTTTITAPAETETVTDTNTVTVTESTTVTETTTVTGAIAGGPNPAPGLDQAMQEGFCHETTTTTPTVTETTTVNTTTTVTSPTTITESTTAPTTRVAPTTITPTDGPTTDDTVSPTTVTPPGGTAFTGVENVIPLGTIAVVLMTAGTGLLWAGSRRGRREEEQG